MPALRKPCTKCGAAFEDLIRAIPRGPNNRVTPPITEDSRTPPETEVVRLLWVRPKYESARIAKVIKLPSAWEWEEFYAFPSIDH